MKAHDWDMEVLREATHFVAFIQIGANRHRADFPTYTQALACVEQWQIEQPTRKGIVYAVNAAGRQVCVDHKMIEQLILEKQS